MKACSTFPTNIHSDGCGKKRPEFTVSIFILQGKNKTANIHSFLRISQQWKNRVSHISKSKSCLKKILQAKNKMPKSQSLIK